MSTVYLQVESLTKSFGDRILFNNVSFGINAGEKIGIIAKNGSGKTTLMNILAGKESLNSGTITFHNGIKVGYLEQLPNLDPNKTIIEVCLDNDIEACRILKVYEQAVNSGADTTRYLELMDAANAWNYEERFKRILSQLEITNFNEKIQNLSGGQIKRIAIAALIMAEPDLLLLDEPTNHLDIKMVEWLEDYITRSTSTLLMVTHDRYFLDKICSKIIEIDDSTLYTYYGNYNYYLTKRSERIESQIKAIDKAKNLYRKELDWMRRQPQARATKAQYRIDAFYDLRQKATQRVDNSKLKLENNTGYIGSKIFEAVNVSKRFEDKVILDNFNYNFARYDKIGIVGDNSVGKSTFIKILQGLINPDSGAIDLGETVKFGYYRQEMIKVDESKKVIDMATDIAEVISFDADNRLTASQFLSKFLFKPADQQKFVYKLSGGEKRRLFLALVLMQKPNFIILDEPTNDLDIVTLEVLEDYLEKFKGCLILISHDRFFMDRCINHLFVFEGDGVIKDFPGNYSEYRAWKQFNIPESTNKPKSEQLDINSKVTLKNRHEAKNRLTFKEKKELELLTTEIDELESEKRELEDVFNGTKKINDGTTFDEISQRYATIKQMLEDKELRWLELSEKEC